MSEKIEQKIEPLISDNLKEIPDINEKVESENIQIAKENGEFEIQRETKESILSYFEGVGQLELYDSFGTAYFRITKGEIKKTVQLSILLSSFDVEFNEFYKVYRMPKPLTFIAKGKFRDDGSFEMNANGGINASFYDYSNDNFIKEKEEYNKKLYYFKAMLITRMYNNQVNKNFWEKELNEKHINKIPKLYNVSEVQNFINDCNKSGLLFNQVIDIINQANQLIEIDKKEFIETLKKV